jgi:3-phenylpropionate/trans-cinnamate dioxygenase ferredoxin reductase subunit
VRLSDGATIGAGTVLVAAGTTPSTTWLNGACSADRTLRTDALGRTTLPGVYAAGDAASFPDAYYGHLPTPHWEAAVRQGLVVAHAIAGIPPPPAAAAAFWSDQHGSRIQVVGHAPPGCDVEFEGERSPDSPFAAWMTCGGRPAAAMLVDRPELMVRARRWLAAGPRTEADTTHQQENSDDLYPRDRRVRVPGAR